MIIKSQRILTDRGMISGALEIENDVIKNIRQINADQMKADLDVKNCIIIPGIIDTHNHGMMGYGPSADAHAAENVCHWMKALSSEGVTGAFPTCMDADAYDAVVEAQCMNMDGAQIMGIHSEGPYLNRVGEKGIDTGHPDISMEHVQQMIDEGQGQLKLVAIAPELPGVDAAIQKFTENGIQCAMAHTNASYEQAMHSFEAGITVTTHTANVMTGIHHRDMGALGAALLNDDVYNEIICDGLHVRNEMIEIMLRTKNDAFHKFMMISDNIPMAGMAPGKYNFENFWVLNITKEGFCLTDTGRLCGSAKSVLYGMKNLVVNMGMDIMDVSRMASLNPAQCYGFADHKGSIRIGKDADFAVLDDNFDCLMTFRQGRCVYDHNADKELINPESYKKWRIS